MGITLFPMADMLLGLSKKRNTNQAKEEIIFPKIKLSKLDKFPKEYENYLNSRMYFTSYMVHYNALLKIKCFGISPMPDKVIVGKHGWLFLAGKYLDNYTGKGLFTINEQEKITSIISNRSQKALKSGRRYYFVIIPDKHNIYADYMPWDIPKSATSNTDFLVNYFKNDTSVNIVDLRPAILAHKNETFPLYYNIDNHWNHYGSYYAYKEVIDVLKKKYHTGEPLSLQEFKLDTTKKLIGGEAEMLNIGDLYNDTRVELLPVFLSKVINGKKKNYEIPKDFPYPDDYEIVKEKPGDTLPSVVIFRDSFLDFMMSYLPEHFRKSVFIFDNWQYRYIDKIVDTENPDIVMTFVFESNLRQIIEWDSIQPSAK